MTTMYTIAAFLIGVFIGVAIRHLSPMHRHTYTGWSHDSHLTIRDEFGSRTHYEIWSATCSECGLPKKKRIKI